MTAFYEFSGLDGVTFGHGTDTVGKTGVTVLRFDAGAVAAVDVRGAAPGTRETDLLKPENLIDRVHAIVLAGGSVWGLDAMSGVVRALESANVGFATGVATLEVSLGDFTADVVVRVLDATQMAGGAP